MVKKEQIIETVGWHLWMDGDGIKKVDRYIRLGNSWHFHVIEDAHGNPADEWCADYEQEGLDPVIFPTKELAIKEDQRQDEIHKKGQAAREAEAESKYAPLIEQLASLSSANIRRIIRKADKHLDIVWKSDKEQWDSMERAFSIIRNGHISHIVKGKITVIPLRSIDHVTAEGNDTRVTTISRGSFIYAGTSMYEDLSNALKILSLRDPFGTAPF